MTKKICLCVIFLMMNSILQNLEDYFCPINYNPVQIKNRSQAGYQVEDPGQWLPESNPLPFPDCSVSSLSSVLSIPTDLRLDEEFSF